ncbi:hypothetical protein EMCRGX_G014529 [Ephydatia muelleri]
MRQNVLLLLSLALVLTPLPLRAQQQGCNAPLSNADVEALIASNYATPQATVLPTIKLVTSPVGFRLICLASFGFRNQYRFVSLVAYFTTSDATVSPPGVPIFGQFEFECIGGSWSSTSTLLDASSFNREILSSNAPAINASLRTDCSLCLNSRRVPNRNTDPINHCKPCTGCTEPQTCFSLGNDLPSLTVQCCNVFLPSNNFACAAECPASPPSFVDTNRTCVPCPLTCRNGGTLQTNGTLCTCACPPQFTGLQCESAIPSPSPSRAAATTAVTTRVVTSEIQTTPISSRAAMTSIKAGISSTTGSRVSPSPTSSHHQSSTLMLKPTPCRGTTTHSHSHHTHPSRRAHRMRMRKHPSGSKKANTPCPVSPQTRKINPSIGPGSIPGPRPKPRP